MVLTRKRTTEKFSPNTSRTPSKQTSEPYDSSPKKACTPTKLSDSSVESPKTPKSSRTPRCMKTPTCTTTPNFIGTPISARTPHCIGTPITVTDDARLKLHVSAIPGTPGRSKLPGPLVCREKEFKTIHSFLQQKLSSKSNGYFYISGRPGAGKTATVHRVIQRLRCENKTKFKYIEINGLYLSDPSKAYCKILEQINDDISTAKQAQNELNAMFNSQKSKKNPTILFIDELDCIYNRSPNVIKNILQWHQKPNSQLIIVTISNDDLIASLKHHFNGKIDITNLCFNDYSNQDLQKIVTDRLQENSTIEPNAIEYLIKKCGSNIGDARTVLDLCRKVLDIISAEKGSDFIATLEETKTAYEKIAHDLYVIAIRSCSDVEKILLRAVRDETSAICGEECSLFERIYFQFQAICTLEGVYCPPIHDVCLISQTLSEIGLIETKTKLVNIHTKMQLKFDYNLINIALHYNS